MQFIPRLAAIYQPAQNHAIKFLYGRAIKAPSIYQLTESLLFDSRLIPSEITTFEVNYLGDISPRLVIDISIFKNTADKLISRFNDVFRSSPWSSNSGNVSNYGMELGLMAKPINQLTVNLTTCYFSSQNNESGKKDIELGYAPKLLGYLKASYLFPHNINLAVSGRYLDRMETKWADNFVMIEPPSAENPYGVFENQPARLGEAIGAYTVWDANLRINAIGGTGLFSNLKIGNVLNQEIRYPATESNPWADKGTLGVGRTVNLGFGVKF
ncbi:MAG: TonB-dependent receptor [Candidatus Zixiibacteriota bacterium]